jgi:hypothetical protein
MVQQRARNHRQQQRQPLQQLFSLDQESLLMARRYRISIQGQLIDFYYPCEADFHRT